MTARERSTLLLSFVGACRFAIAATGAHWALAGETPAAWVAVGALVLSLVPGRALRDVVLRDAVAACTTALLALHVVVGMLGGLYETSTAYDKVVHLVASAIIAGLLLLAATRWSDRSGTALPDPVKLLLVLAGTVTLGTLWELFEFTVDLTGAFVAQRGLTDTMLDLLADTLGALLTLAAFMGQRGLRARLA